MVVPVQDVPNPVSLTSFYLLVGYSSPPWPYVIPLHFSWIGAAGLLHPSPEPHFKTFQVSWSVFWSVQVLSPYKAMLQMYNSSCK